MRRRSIALVSLAVVALIAVGVIGFVALRGGGASGTALGAPRFVDETAAAGVDHTYGGSSTYAVGGGVAVFDCNGDGEPELYLAGGGDRAALYRNESTVGGPLRFAPLLDPATDLTAVDGAYPLDIDGDGIVDLAVLRSGENVLLRGLGDCRFERANEAFGFDGGKAQTMAFSATWEGTGLPTMAVGNYLQLDATGESGLDCDESELVRPASNGTTYAPPLSLGPGYCTLSMLFSDWDRTGRRDLRMSNDRQYYRDGEEQLWQVADGAPPRPYTKSDGWVSLQIWGMGIASQDLTGDGLPEVFLTSQGDNKLQTLAAGPSQPTYRDIALARGVTATSPYAGDEGLPSTAWHPEFEDVNNDGFMDLYISKGNVEAQAEYAVKDPSNLFLGRADGTFVEGAEAAGIVDFARGRGAALADFNLDGLLDLVQVNYGDPVRLWRNVGSGDAARPAPMGHWLAVRPSEPGSNHDAIGAWVEVKAGDVTVQRESVVGGGHVGGQLGWTHVGLGPATEAQVRVQWPDGEIGPWLPVAADGFVDVVRGATAVRPWTPPVR